MTAAASLLSGCRPASTRSIGIFNHEVNRAMLSASGFPVPFSILDNVDAETPVSSATSRKLSSNSSRRRRIARPSSWVLTSALAMRGMLVHLTGLLPRYHSSVLVARSCFILETPTLTLNLIGAQKFSGERQRAFGYN